MNLGKAIRIAATAHEKHEDRGNNPYILHSVQVCQNPILKDEDEKVVAVLHDVLEMTGHPALFLEFLKEEGLTDRQEILLVNVTRNPGEMQSEYINRVASDHGSVRIKIADLEHNMDIKRITDGSKISTKLLSRYHSVWIYLKNLLNEASAG